MRTLTLHGEKGGEKGQAQQKHQRAVVLLIVLKNEVKTPLTVRTVVVIVV